MKVEDFDVVFVSFDEPNADDNFENIKKYRSNAKRVSGVRGIAAAHKRAATVAETDMFFIVDGDTYVNSDFWVSEIDFHSKNVVHSFASKNVINDLEYGNGGIKLWPKAFLLKVESHEQNGTIDWIHKLPYYQVNACYSETRCNASALQAFRAGFREGVKFCHPNGVDRDVKGIWWENLQRLKIWMSLGRDVTNGEYAIYGARLGFWMSGEASFNLQQINEYNWFKVIFRQHVELKDYIAVNQCLLDGINGRYDLGLVDLSGKQSEFVKSIYNNLPRQGIVEPAFYNESYLKYLGVYDESGHSE